MCHKYLTHNFYNRKGKYFPAFLAYFIFNKYEYYIINSENTTDAQKENLAQTINQIMKNESMNR